MNWFNKSIQNKLLAIICGGAFAIILASMASYQSSLGGMDKYDVLINKDIENERLISTMLVDFKMQVQEWKNTLLRGYDDENREKYWGRFQAKEVSIQDTGAQLLSSLENQEARTLVSDFIAEHKKMGGAYLKGFSEFVAQGYDHKVGDKAVKGIDRQPAKLLSEASALIALQVKEQSVLTSEEAHTALTISNLILGLIIIAFAVVAMWVINRGIVIPSRSLIDIITNISQGNIKNDIAIKRQDELGQLANASRGLQDFMLELSNQLVHTDGRLKTAALELSGSAEQLFNHINTANESTDHIASAMTEMSATATEVASHAATAAGLASDADKAAHEGVDTMQNAQQAIDELSTQIENTVQVVQRLEEDTNNVGQVLSVIRGIAEQTNLLALNAAIEAARAGEQGRGFAVVADEVRSLAQKTQSSTAEIEGIIESVQNGAKNTASVMGESSTITANSAEMFNAASERLSIISSSISQINELNMQVATAAEQQTNVSEDIAKSVVEMSDLVDSTKSSASQSLTLSEELNGVAHNLEGLSNSLVA